MGVITMGQAKRRGSFEERKKMAINRDLGIPENTCIICRQKKEPSDFNDEHVIPDSLNGYYHIKTVCKNCNSTMGTLIDGPLMKHKLTDLYRWSNKIAGKSGKIPKPFKGVFKRQDSQEKYKFFEDKSGVFNLIKLPSKPVINDIGDGKVEVNLSFDESTSNVDIQKAINKVLDKHKLDKEKIEITKSQRSLDKDVPFVQTWNIDTLKFKLGLLKIAYEFAVDNIPSYYSDTLAIQISELLVNADISKLDTIKMGGGLDFELFDKIETFFNYENRHVIWLMPTDNKLICFIRLDSLFAIPIVVANKPYIAFEESVIGINDLDKKEFTCSTIQEVLLNNGSPTYTRFLYYIDTLSHENVSDYKLEINDAGREYIGEAEGNPILYSQAGKVLCRSFDKFLNTCEVETKVKDDSFVSFFKFDEANKYFIKGKRTGKLYQVVGFEIERKLQKI